MKNLKKFSYFILFAIVLSHPVLAEVHEQHIFAAASVKRGLQNVLKNYSKKARVSYASSGAVARQINRGAPANIFISAHESWINWLIEKGDIVKKNIFPLMETKLVIAKNKKAYHVIGHLPEKIFLTLRNNDFVSTGDPAHVPLGQYSRVALKNADVWDLVRTRIAPMQNAQAATKLVVSGATPIGILYKADLIGLDNLEILYEFPIEISPRIRYFIAKIQKNSTANTEELLSYLRSSAATSIWEQNGFLRPQIK